MRYGKSARERAAMFAAILHRRKPQHGGTDFGRSLDHCFESGDGSAVAAWIIARIAGGDTALVDSIFSHHPNDGESWWLTRVCLAFQRGDVAAMRAEFDKQCEDAKCEKPDPDVSPRGIVLPKWPYDKSEQAAPTSDESLFSGIGGAP